METIAADEVREAVLEVSGKIKNLAEAMPLMYDNLKSIADKFPDTHREIHVGNISGDLDEISAIAAEGARLIRDNFNKKEVSHE